ncbi:MAG TPA: PEP-CTERM sorting domain-containing protein [Candidatus Acidoferrum sp.]|nr:PEP-CTERM sorting domain-containing protein [Candidatus Acidoferrum sp.]
MEWRWYWKSWDKCDELIRSSWRLTQVILLLGTILPLLLVIWKLGTEPPSPVRVAPVVSAIPRPTAEVPLTGEGVRLRPLLPYSVIPGGARDPQELRDAIAHDPVVATHYADFNLGRARVVRLDRDTAVYVSYRLGDRVYWTSKKLMLPKGETVLTDGQHEARTRCGNRLSAAPKTPTALREPERAALENPQPPELTALPMPAPELPISPLGPLVPPPEETPPGHIFIPPLVPIFWIPPGTPSTPIVPPPVKGIPEPGSLLLLSMGFGSVWLVRRKREFQIRRNAAAECEGNSDPGRVPARPSRVK